MTSPAVFSVDELKLVLREQLSIAAHSTVYIAYSGGVDSHVLLHALSCLAVDYPLVVHAIHVDHNLHSQSAEWAQHCQLICDQLDIPLTIQKVSIEPGTGESLEAAAREARYSALAELLPDNGICMTAQHSDDQSETIFLQLLRGAGVHGLAAMPPVREFARGQLIRPLLAYSREALLDYACAHRLQWREDPSNEDNRFDRNFLRNEILPLMRERWPGMDSSLSRSARHMAGAVQLLDEMAQQDLLHCGATENHFFSPCIAYLNARLLSALPEPHQLNALRRWVRLHGMTVPGDARLQSLLSLLAESPEKGELLWHCGAFRLYNGMLWLCNTESLIEPCDEVKHWDTASPLPLAQQGMMLCAKESTGQGIARARVESELLEVRFRQGGEVCRMPGDHGSKQLKTLLQELGVPPWLRASLPLIYLRDELVAVSSLWSNAHFIAAAGEPGVVFSLHRLEQSRE